MEKSVAETASPVPNDRPHPMSEAVASQEPENTQSDIHNPANLDLVDDRDVQYETGIRLATIISSVTLTAFLITLDGSIIATPVSFSLPEVGWYGSAYLLSSSALQPVTGKLYAHFSLKYTYITFLALFEFGSLICGVATSSNMLIIGRAIAGMGSSGVGNGALTILSASIPLEKRALYFSITASVGQMGVVLGPLIGGALTEYTTWRWCFYINLPIGGLAIASLVWVAVPNTSSEGPKQMNFTSLFHELDITGCLLFSPTMVMFLLAIEWGGSTYPWNSAVIIGLFCGAAGNLALFLIWEHKKGESAMIPFQMVKKRAVYSAGLCVFFLYANNLMTSYYLSIYFQGVRGKTPTLSGVYMLPGIISLMVSGITAGLTVTRVGYYLPLAVIGTVLTAVGSGLISTFTQYTKTGTWIGYQIIGGLGRGLSMQMPLVAVQNNLPASQIAVSMAFLSFSQNFGGSLFLSFAETAFGIGLGNALPRYAPGVPVDKISSIGVSGIRSMLPQSDVEGVIMAYAIAVQQVFYIVAATATVAFIFSWGLGWKSVKKARNTSPEA